MRFFIWQIVAFFFTASLAFAGKNLNQPRSMDLRITVCQTQIALPQPDADGRRKVKNQRGFEDSQFNETQLAFIARAKSRAPLLQRFESGFKRQPMVMEVGMAYGSLGVAIVSPDVEKKLPGAFYFGIDMDRLHVKIAEARLQAAQVHPSQYQTFTAQIPIAVSDTSTRRDLAEEFVSFEITDLGMFSVAMYLDGMELQAFMKWAFDLLPSGGRLYMTAISPYANLYPGYEATYLHRRDILQERFPGYVADVRAPEMRPYVSNLDEYLSKYPHFFHLLEPAVLKRTAEECGFVTIEAKYLRRFFPKSLVYTGNDPTVGELASFIGEKP